MKLNILYITGLFFLFSCNKFDGPYIENIESVSFYKIGENQRVAANSYFIDSIGLTIYNNKPDYSTKGYTAHLTVVSGGGIVDDEMLLLSNGTAKTKWKSGTTSCKQQIQIEIYDNNNKWLKNLLIESFAFRKNAWDTITAMPDRDIRDILGDTLSGKTFMISGSQLYNQAGEYFNWILNPSMNVGPFSLHNNASGTLYMSTWYGEIYKSTNSGQNWTTCSKPIPNHPYYYYMTVSNNGYLYTSTPEYKKSLRCSRDGGITWTADTTGLITNDMMGDVYKLSNGEMLFHSSSTWMYKSVDDGKSWELTDCPEYSTKLFVTDKEEIIIFNQENGVSIHKSTDWGQSYRKVHTVRPEYGTIMSDIIQKKGNYYYIAIPGYGIIRTTDFEDFDDFYRNRNIVFLYQTHEGVLIARGLDSNAAYYFSD